MMPVKFSEKNLFRKDCPACLSKNVSHYATIPYRETFRKWDIYNDQDYLNFLGEVPSDLHFEVSTCNVCRLNFVNASYEGLVETVEGSSVYHQTIIAPWLDVTQKEMDISYAREIQKSRPQSPGEMRVVGQEWTNRLSQVYTIIAKYLEEGSKYLDLGSNIGGFAEFIRLNSPDTDITCCEINPFYVKKMKERYPHLNKIIDQPLTRENGEQEFDFIYCSHVIEHIWNIEEFILAIREHMAEGGNLMLLTPDGDCQGSRMLRENWWAYIVPHHCQIFNVDSLANLMGRYGFKHISSGRINEEFWSIFRKTSLTPETSGGLEHTLASLHQEAEQSFESGDYAGAEAAFANICSYEDVNYNAFYKLGISQFKQEKYEEAVDSFSTCLELGTCTVELCRLLAQSLEKTGDDETAEMFYEKAKELG